MAKKKQSKDKARDDPESNDDQGSCFRIMPFGGWYDEYYEEIFRPAIKDTKMNPRRADDLFRPDTIVRDIWSYTKEAEIILADLSGKNANVLYELGLAHALAKPAILVTESVDDVPFDLRALRVIEFDKNDHNWGEILRKKITRSIGEILEDPLRSIPPAFLEVDESKRSTKVSPEELELLEIRREIDQLKREVRRGSGRSRIGAREAELLIRSMFDDDIPDELIVSRVAGLGAPRQWVQRRLDNLKPSEDDDDIPF